MPTFIKTGYWEKLQKGFKNYLNLDELIQSLSPPSAITADELDAIQSANAPDASNPFATVNDVPSSDELDAISGANSPDSTNPFATMADVGGGGGIEDITYADLVTAIGASGLVEGQLYKITDFATVHWMVDATMGEGLMYSYILDGVGEKIIHTGENEPLVVLATSVNTLAPEAYSTLHPTDALKYDWNPLNYSTIKQFYDGDTLTSPAGFKGIITRREDVAKAIKTNYDFREITYRLYSIEQPAWAAQAYSRNDIVQVGNALYGANATTESTDEPGDSAKWTFLIDITENAFLSYSATSHYIHPFSITIQDTDDFTDRTMDDDDTCSNIVFEECNFIPYVTYGSGCNKMTYGSNCYAMTYGSNCGNMTYGSSCHNMTYGSYCNNMTYGSGCYNMTYGSGCYSMTYPDFTAYNDFKDGVGNIDFTGAGITQITNGTTITHQLSGLVVYQSYIDASSTPTMVITTNTIGVYS